MTPKNVALIQRWVNKQIHQLSKGYLSANDNARHVEKFEIKISFKLNQEKCSISPYNYKINETKTTNIQFLKQISSTLCFYLNLFFFIWKTLNF